MADKVETWDRRAQRADLYAVLTNRWSLAQCAEADRQQRAALSAVMPTLAGRYILDLGCGIGRITGWLAGNAVPDGTGLAVGPTAAPGRVIGVDFSGNMLAQAARDLRLANVSFVCACAQQLPFLPRSFDVTVTIAVLQHLIADEDFGLACEQAARSLRPGGVLVCLEGVSDLIGSGSRTTVRPDAGIGAAHATGGGAGSATGTVRRTLAQYAEALAPWLVLDRTLPLRCVEDEYMVSRWTRVAGVD
jgi:ubiquinone/menaquinone biosynthesis C-methylase UbiE